MHEDQLEPNFASSLVNSMTKQGEKKTNLLGKINFAN